MPCHFGGVPELTRSSRFRGALVAAEIAISLVLLVSAGLLVRSFWSMLQVKPGLDPARVGFAQIWIPVPNDPSKNPYGTPAQRNAYINEVLSRVAALPGIESVGMSASNRTPFSGSGVTQRFTFAGESTAPADVRRAQFQVASPDYFSTLKSPILSGRAFTAADTIGTEPVVIVNETLAKTQSPGKDPVGRSISLGRQSARIVGIVADIHDDGLDVPVASRIYFPLFQRSNNALTVFYRSSTDPAALGTTVERAIHDDRSDAAGLRTEHDGEPARGLDGAAQSRAVADGHVRDRRAAAGGDRHLRCDERRGERARARDWDPHGARGAAARHRAADGASRPHARHWRRCAGVLGAAFLARLMSAVLFAVTPTDAVTYALVSLLLIVVALAACYVPARRATKQDPAGRAADGIARHSKLADRAWLTGFPRGCTLTDRSHR